MNDTSRFFLVKMFVVSVIFACATPFFVSAQQATFYRSLTIGSVGEDVRNLQKILNSSPETAIRSTGIGSSGQESTYFGALTRDAVVRFQEKYRGEILTPNGLVSGTGYVGPSTRSVLQKLALGTSVSSNTSVAVVDKVANNNDVVAVEPPQVLTSNPNEENLDKFLAAVDRVGTQQGLSVESLKPIMDQIRKDVATTTNLMETFIEVVESSISKAPETTRGPLTKLLDTIKLALVPKKAHAIGTPFGGQLFFPFFCTCSANWLVTIQPLPPTYVTLLSYTPGTQTHLSYNIPFTTKLLGQYTPGAGICTIFVGTGCVAIPSEGMITPTVGSSAI